MRPHPAPHRLIASHDNVQYDNMSPAAVYKGSARKRQTRLKPSPVTGAPRAEVRCPNPYFPSRSPAVSPTLPLHPVASACTPPSFAGSLLVASGEEQRGRADAQEAGGEGIRAKRRHCATGADTFRQGISRWQRRDTALL